MAEVQDEKVPYTGWTILELMGHRKLGGFVTEQTVAGAAFIRIDVPGVGDEAVATQFYSPAAVYCITPTTEEMARGLAASCRPQPVSRWELPKAVDSPARDERDDQWDEDDRDEDDDRPF